MSTAGTGGRPRLPRSVLWTRAMVGAVSPEPMMARMRGVPVSPGTPVMR